jgi:hypothetical protein
MHTQTEASLSLGLNYNQVKLQLDEEAKFQKTAECAEQSRPEEESGTGTVIMV